ncbi:MAG: hypothetical protein K0U98_25315 [Deltaproteobacteria bacterium]|nr:hypothetical protein [Deltaproteobacteria bacterium]
METAEHLSGKDRACLRQGTDESAEQDDELVAYGQLVTDGAPRGNPQSAFAGETWWV